MSGASLLLWAQLVVPPLCQRVLLSRWEDSSFPCPLPHPGALSLSPGAAGGTGLGDSGASLNPSCSSALQGLCHHPPSKPLLGVRGIRFWEGDTGVPGCPRVCHHCHQSPGLPGTQWDG